MNPIATMPVSIAKMISPDDYAELTSCPPKAQFEVSNKLTGIQELLQAQRGQKTAIADRIAKARGVSRSTVYNELDRYKKQGVSALIDLRKFPKESGGLPKLFISWVEGLFDAHQRMDEGAEVYRKIIDRLNQWRYSKNPDFAIPGYDEPPANHPSYDHPPSWSYKNIMRIRTSMFERMNSKRGEKEANKYISQVLTTRVGSAYLSRIMTDDQDYDNLLEDGTLALAGIKGTQRPVSFNALDFYTAAHIGHHMRLEYETPERKDTDGNKIKGTKKTLTSIEYQWFIIGLLQKHGYRTDKHGTVIVGEWKTAAPWQNKKLSTINGFSSLSDALAFVTEGKVTCEKSGRVKDALFKGMVFKPSATGNFKFKTWIETSFRLLRTYMQALPGNMGSNERLNGSAELYGIRQKADQHARAIADLLDPHSASLIKRELLDFPKFYQLVEGVYRALNSRDDHNMEGWAQCGFTEELWRPSTESTLWYTEEDLQRISDPIERKMLKARINSNKEQLTRTRKCSPGQAAELCIHHDKKVIKKLEDRYVGLLLPWEWAKEVTVRDGHAFTLKNPLWEDMRDTYVAQFKDSNGILTTMPHGMKMMVFADPYGDGRAHLYTPSQEYIGTIWPTVRAEPFNQEKTQVQLETRSSLKSVMTAQQRARYDDIAAHRTERDEFNKRLIAGEETNPQKRRSNSAQQGIKTRQSNKVKKTVRKRGNSKSVLDALASPQSSKPAKAPKKSKAPKINPFIDSE